MFSLSNIPSTQDVFSASTSVAASAMLIRAMTSEAKNFVNQCVPKELQTKFLSILGLYGRQTREPELTLIINEYSGCSKNEMYEAAVVYLGTKTNASSLERLVVTKHEKEKNLTVTAEKDQDIVDAFEHIEVKWRLIYTEKESSPNGRQHKFFELSFPRQYKEPVLGSYLPYVLKRSKSIIDENMALKLYSLDGGKCRSTWNSINLNHPATFDTLALETNLKKELMEDLDRFVKRRDFYKRVGKAWKRGYLLYGPPGTGKSSLVAAMANYLNFNVYDLELTSITSNSELRKLLVGTSNRSILVIEDIDCSIELKDRATRKAGKADQDENNQSQLTLSGLLNFIDGLWSSCGDERIIVFTTNYKEKLDPALLRPGRMDMHIHLSYCTPCGFKLLASNYLQIQSDPLFEEIEFLLKNVQVTPAEVAEELMRSDDTKASLQGLINLLHRKKTELVKCDTESECGVKTMPIKN